MGTYVDQSCYGWPREDLSDQADSGEISVSQMLDCGSISFGRFALEPLSWEKRSVFTRNRYQEELETIRAPGLVAQKKAYFEEYYKKIRAMKALQEEQLIDSSCFGDSSGISAQIMDDNRRVVPNECHDEVMVTITGPGIKVSSTKETLEINTETELEEPCSHAKISTKNKNLDSSFNTMYHQKMNINPSNYESVPRIIEDSEPHDFTRLADEQVLLDVRLENISGPTGAERQRIVEKECHREEFKADLLEIDPPAKLSEDDKIGEVRLESFSGLAGEENQRIVEKRSHRDEFETDLLKIDPPAKFSEDDKRGEATRNKQLQSMDQILCDHEPIAASIEDSKHFEFINQINEETFRKSDYAYLASSSKVLEPKLTNKELKNVSQAVKWHKGYTFTSEMTKNSSSAGDFIKSERKTKPRTAMLNQALRDSSQKRNDQNNFNIILTHRTSDRILRGKHVSGDSHGSHKEGQFKVTTPCPFSLSTGKQAVSCTSVLLKSGYKNLSSTPLSERNINSKGVSGRLGYSSRRDKLERKRGIEELGNKPFSSVDRQAAHLNGGSKINVIRPLEARSINLPSCRGGVTDFGIKSGKFVRNDDVGKAKLVDMMASSRVRDPTLNTKNLPRGDGSLNRRKLEKEKPRWRW